jgi:hypothetical protein
VDRVKDLLRNDFPHPSLNPESEGSQEIPETSEFLGVCRARAYDAVENATNGTQPLIKEDMLFVELEMRRQKMANQRDRAKLDGAKKVVIPCAVVVALFIGWASGFDGVLCRWSAKMGRI